MKKIFFLFLILFSLKALGNEIICENKINIINPVIDEYGAAIGYPNLNKTITLSSRGHIYEMEDAQYSFKVKLLINTNNKSIKMYHKTFSSQKWGKPINKKFKIISNDDYKYFVEILNEFEEEKEFFWISKSLNMYTRSVVRPGSEQITRGECTSF